MKLRKGVVYISKQDLARRLGACNAEIVNVQLTTAGLVKLHIEDVRQPEGVFWFPASIKRLYGRDCECREYIENWYLEGV